MYALSNGDEGHFNLGEHTLKIGIVISKLTSVNIQSPQNHKYSRSYQQHNHHPGVVAGYEMITNNRFHRQAIHPPSLYLLLTWVLNTSLRVHSSHKNLNLEN